jgi:hypothetical protein
MHQEIQMKILIEKEIQELNFEIHQDPKVIELNKFKNSLSI